MAKIVMRFLAIIMLVVSIGSTAAPVAPASAANATLAQSAVVDQGGSPDPNLVELVRSAIEALKATQRSLDAILARMNAHGDKGGIAPQGVPPPQGQPQHAGSGFRTPVYESQPSSVQGNRTHRGQNTWKGKQLTDDVFTIPANSWLIAQGDARGNGTCVIMLWKGGNPVKPSDATYHLYTISGASEQAMMDEVAVIQQIAAREVSPNGDPAACPVVNGPTR